MPDKTPRGWPLFFISLIFLSTFSVPSLSQDIPAQVAKEPFSNKASLREAGLAERNPFQAEDLSLYLAVENSNLTRYARIASGDINGDGEEDLVVSLPTQSINREMEGAVHIIYSYSKWATRGTPVNHSSHVTILGGIPYRRLGETLLVYDLNNDGLDDIIIGSPDSPAQNGSRFPLGEVFIVLGREDLWGEMNVEAAADYRIVGRSPTYGLGMAISPGDFDGDGSIDLAISSDYTDRFGELKRGAVLFFFGNGSWEGVGSINSSTSRVNGTVDGEMLGQKMAVGDFDGDGIDDLALSSQISSSGGAKLLRGGAYLRHVNITSTALNITLQGAYAGDRLGTSLIMTDINGDGRDDLLSGAPGYDDVGVDSGAVFIYYGRAFPSVTTTLSALQTDQSIVGTDSSDLLGYSLTSVDLNGDGVEELVVAAPGAAGGMNMHPYSGMLYIFGSDLSSGRNFTTDGAEYSIQCSSYRLGWFLSSGGGGGRRGVLLVTALGGRASESMVEKMGEIMVLKTSTVETRMILGESGSNLGESVVFGDFNGDGGVDLALGAPQLNLHGGVYIFYNVTEIETLVDLNYAEADVTVIPSGAAGNSFRFGIPLRVGDLNGDGIDDLAIGACKASAPGFQWQAGRVYILFGNRSLPSSMALPSPGRGVLIYGARAGDEAGTSLDVGDLDGDGIDDLVIGAPGGDGPQDSRDWAGDAYIFFGRGVWPQTLFCSNGIPIWGAHSRDRLAAGDILISDLNSDGYGEVIIGSPLASPSSLPQSGMVSVIWGMNRTSWNSYSTTGYDLKVDPSATLTGPYPGYMAGTSLALVDLNSGGNGTVESLAIGVPGADGENRTLQDAGAVYFVDVEAIPTGNSTLPLRDGYTSILWGVNKGGNLGVSVASGDVDSDAALDLLLGDLSGTGRFYMATTNYLPVNASMDVDVLPTLQGASSDYAGSVSSLFAQDLSGDGYAEVVCGMPGGSSGGVAILLVSPFKGVPKNYTRMGEIRGGFWLKDDYGKIVLFSTEAPYTLPVEVYLPPGDAAAVSTASVLARGYNIESWLNMSTSGLLSTTSSGYGVEFLNTSSIHLTPASVLLNLNFTFPLPSSEPARWIDLHLYDSSGRVIYQTSIPLRWVGWNHLELSMPSQWTAGERVGCGMWIPGARDVTFSPIRLRYSIYNVTMDPSPYTPVLSLPQGVTGRVTVEEDSLSVTVNASQGVRTFNFTLSLIDPTGELTLPDPIKVELMADSEPPYPPRDFRVYPSGPYSGEGLYDSEGEVYIEFDPGWDEWGPSMEVRTYLEVLCRSNGTPLGPPEEVSPGSWIELPEGEFLLALYSEDSFSNPSERVFKEVTVDRFPLTLRHLSPSPGWVSSSSVNFTVEVESGPSGVLPGSVKLQVYLPSENLSSEWIEGRVVSENRTSTIYSCELSLPDGLNYAARWMAISGSSMGPYYSQPLFFSVDTAAPSLLSSTPEMDQFVSGDALVLTATFRDPLSGLNLSTAAFRMGPAGAIMSLPWESLNIAGTVEEVTLQAKANLTFDGPGAYQWMISDVAGNLLTTTTVPFTVDHIPPSFLNVSHKTGSVIEGKSVTVEIEIYDPSGIDLDSVEFSYSNPNTWTEFGVGIYGFGPWEAVDTVTPLDPLSLRVLARATVPLVEGDFNYVKFRVADRAGNVAESPVYRYTSVSPPVNHPPTLTITLPIDMATFPPDAVIEFSVNVTDVDGDSLTVKWYSNRSGYLGEGKTFSKRLESGVHLITARVSDGEYTVERTVNITVMAPPPSREVIVGSEKTVWEMLSENPVALFAILLPGIFFGLFAGYLMFRRPPATEIEEMGEGGVAGEVLVTPPPKKYTCPECGGVVREGEEYCVNCGREFTEEDWKLMKRGKRPGKRKREVEEDLYAEEEIPVVEEEGGFEEVEFEEVEDEEEPFEEIENGWEE